MLYWYIMSNLLYDNKCWTISSAEDLKQQLVLLMITENIVNRAREKRGNIKENRNYKESDDNNQEKIFEIFKIHHNERNLAEFSTHIAY